MTDPYLTAIDMLSGEALQHDVVEHAGKLLEKASAEGNAEASERCALFEAFGMARPQSWPAALDFLARAAEQGSRSAQEQLLLLNDSEIDPQPSSVAGETDWQAMRATIDLQRRLVPGEKQSLSDSPRIRLIKSFATAAECRWLIRLASDRLAPATVFDEQTGSQTRARSRDNGHFVLRIEVMNVFTEVIRTRISAAARLPVPLFEPSQLLHYAPGERFKAHHDYFDPGNEASRQQLERFGQRIATFLIYLNDSYSGGATSFPSIGLNYRGDIGDGLFFANVTREGTPDALTLHAGLPPTSGEKWVFSQWIRDQFPAHR